MPSLSQAKTLGGIGSILVICGAVPYAGGLLAIVGFILTLLAVKNLSDYFGDRLIFRDMMIAVALAIVGTIVGVVAVVGSVAKFVGFGNLYSSFQTHTVPSGNVADLIGGIILGLALLWVFFLVSAVFLRRSYDEIGSKVNVGMFETAALIYLIGAVLTIVILGFLLIFVAQILLIVAWFSIPEAPAPPQKT